MASLSASYIIELDVARVTESSTCLSYVRASAACVRLMTVGRASPGWLSRKRHRAECLACFAMLDVTRVISLATGLPRACYKTGYIYINGSMP